MLGILPNTGQQVPGVSLSPSPLDNSFSLNLDTRVKSPVMMARKTATPSTVRRNATRKKAFLESKNEKILKFRNLYIVRSAISHFRGGIHCISYLSLRFYMCHIFKF